MDDEGAAYLRALESRYVALRGRGFMLSAHDVARIERWRERQVPLRVALRVIEEGTLEWRRSQRRVGAPRTLGYFDRGIREAQRKRAERGLDVDRGQPPAAAPTEVAGETVWDQLLAGVAVAGRAQHDDRVRDTLRRAWRRLRAGRDAGEDVWALTAEVDAAIVVELAEAVGVPGLAAVRSEAEVALQATDSGRMTEQARQERYRFELNHLLRSRLGVPELLEVLLEQSM